MRLKRLYIHGFKTFAPRTEMLFGEGLTAIVGPNGAGKSRVRLRDVLDVAATLGQAYTVVGQGLVDAALSLRPEERRELFEEAAAIRGYFVQREDALRRLTRTEENVARVHDLAAELEPQVRRMERQARQAQEYKDLQQKLHELLEAWYSSRWLAATTELR